MNAPLTDSESAQFVSWFRQSLPYMQTFRDQTFVIVLDGYAIADNRFQTHIQDIALLHSIGIKTVIVHGAEPQAIEQLQQQKLLTENRLPDIIDANMMPWMQQSIGNVKSKIEAQISLGVSNSPLAGHRIRVATGNYLTALPKGVIDGRDHLFAGKLRKVDTDAIKRQLKDASIVLVSPLGYSFTGEMFYLDAKEVATRIALSIKAAKLIFLTEDSLIRTQEGELIRELTLSQADDLLTECPSVALNQAVSACRQGIKRSHLLDHHQNGALLVELFTRDGLGTLISAGDYQTIRPAELEDLGGLTALLEPLMQQGILVPRTQAQIEAQLSDYFVETRDGMIVGSVALHKFAHTRIAELACLAVDERYRTAGRGQALLAAAEEIARKNNIDQIVVLTTQTAHWFVERGYAACSIEDLPVEKKMLYNHKRNSKAFLKNLTAKT